LFKKLIALRFDNDQKVFHVIERQLVLKILLIIMMHLDGFKKPKSVEVQKKFFHKTTQIE
jgi:DNA repair protein RecO (recombination protein O)